MGSQIPKKRDKSDSRTELERFLDLAKKRLKRCLDAEDPNRTAGLDDLRFFDGGDVQWDQREVKKRRARGRPVLTVNELPKYVAQVTGDSRHNRPRIKVRPLSSGTSAHVASLREGLITSIEHYSNADSIYDQAHKQQVVGRYGAWRVLTRWCDDDPWVQEIYMGRLPNPYVAYLDPDAKDFMGADANFGFILEKMRKEEFQDRYPDADVPGEVLKSGTGTGQELWYDKDHVLVTEYFVRSTRKVTLCKMADGSVMEKSEADRAISDWEAQTERDTMVAVRAVASIPEVPDNQVPPNLTDIPPLQPVQSAVQSAGPKGQPPPGVNPLIPGQQPSVKSPAKPVIEKSKEVDWPDIRHYLITATDILGDGSEEERLQGRSVPGDYIPIVIIKGREINIEGKTVVKGLFSDAKDPQRLLNYWITTAAETVAMAPKSQWLGTQKQFEGYEQDYTVSNTDNLPYLKYNSDPSAPGPPTRISPQPPPVAVFTQIAEAKEAIKSSIGMFNADMGDQSPERTGAAVMMKQRPGDVGTFEFFDNFCKGVAYTGRIINSMIPYVYDSERDIRLRGIDDSESWIPVNTTAQSALNRVTADPERYHNVDVDSIRYVIRTQGENARFNDLTVGKYDIVITVGPSYATARAEAAQAMMTLAQAMPREMRVALDLIVSNLDFKDADKLAERFRTTVLKGMIPPRPGDKQLPPQPPPPQLQAVIERTKTEQIKQQVQLLKAKLEGVKLIKEIKGGEQDIRQQVLKVLDSILSPEHPADMMAGQGPNPNSHIQ